MKRCSNPNCEPSIIFGESKNVCPFCNSVLMSISNQPEVVASSFQSSYPSVDRYSLSRSGHATHQVPFVNQRGKYLECRGRILEVEHHELFNNRSHKMFNSLFEGEPYQYGHQTIEYAIRVENITDSFSTQQMDFFLFGNFLGTLQRGDEVKILAKRKHGRNIVISIFNETTGSTIYGGSQLSSSGTWAGLLLAAIGILLLLMTAYWVITSGILTRLAMSIASAFMPLIITCFIIRLLIGRILH